VPVGDSTAPEETLALNKDSLYDLKFFFIRSTAALTEISPTTFSL